MHRIKEWFVVLVAVVASTNTVVFAQAPAWWADRDVINTNAVPNDFAPINQGQVKWLATQAAAELAEKLQAVGGAGSNVAALLATFSPTNNYLPVNLGQLKNVAKPFYDRLLALGLTKIYPVGAGHPYPWSNSTNRPNDYALANIGQAKYVFSFDTSVDSDGDGLPDIWEVNSGLNPINANDAGHASANLFAHGISNLQVYQNPSVLWADGYSSLGDGIPDWWKISTGYSPTTPGSTVGVNGLTLTRNYQNDPACLTAISAALDQFNVGLVDQLRSVMNLSPFNWEQPVDNSARIAQIRVGLESVLVNCLDLKVHGSTLGETNVVVKWTVATVLNAIGNPTGNWLSGPPSLEQVNELQAVLSQLIRVPSEGSTLYAGVSFLNNEDVVAGCYMTWSVRDDMPSQWPTNWLVATYVLFSTKDQNGLFLDDYLILNGAANRHYAYFSGNTEVTDDWISNHANEVEVWDEFTNTLYCSEFHIAHVLEMLGPKVNIAIDGNHDPTATMDFDNSGYKKCTFWLNDDHDVISSGEEDDVNDNVKDCDRETNGTGGRIACKRDLEDFVRVHLQVDDHTAHLPGVTYHLKFANVTAGSPAVNIFEAINETPEYLTDSNVAGQQIQQQNLTMGGVNRAEVQLDSRYIKSGDQVSPFIIEGRSAGVGDLTFIVKQDGMEIGRKSVALELHQMEWFYDMYRVDVTLGDSWDVQIPGKAAQLKPYAGYQPVTEEKFLLVHGWNMAEPEKIRWVETTFKRLWWQGYHGSVALFSWPTGGITNFWDVVTNPHNFDNSEFRSWLSADALIGIFNTLNADGNLRVLAHSMGNVVTGEALRRYTDENQNLHTYIACQAAVSAQCYENTAEATNPCQQRIYDLFFPNTPDILGFFPVGAANPWPYMGANKKHVYNMYNYFNEQDWALDKWEINNVRKPDNVTPYLFDYQGSKVHYQEGADKFTRGLISNPKEILSVYDQRQRFLIFAYDEESRSRALGQITVGAFQSWNLHAAQSDGGMGYDKQHYSHSREFRSNIADETRFWGKVFGACQFRHP